MPEDQANFAWEYADRTHADVQGANNMQELADATTATLTLPGLRGTPRGSCWGVTP